MKLHPILLLVLLAPPSLAQVIYVDDSAQGSADGSSWIDAFVELPAALAAAPDEAEIWVAEGVYRPSSTLDRRASFVVPEGVQLLGGFAGDESTFAERAGLFEQTILSGDLAGDDGPDFQQRAENSFTVVRAGGSTMTMDGFRITGGNANGAAFGERVGGGLFVEFPFYGPIRNCTFEENESQSGGGAVYSGLTAERYEHCRFLHNRSSGPGGALWDNSTQTGSVVFVNCGFYGNAAGGEGGGAIRLYNAYFQGCVFTGNSANECTLGGGAILGSGVSMVNSTVYGNTAHDSGQGTGGILVEIPSALNNSVLWANQDGLSEVQDAQFKITVSDAVFQMANSLMQGFNGTLSPDWNLASNPMLQDPDGPDNVLGTGDDQPWPGALSPCLDAADLALYAGPSVDLEGGLRVVDALDCDDSDQVLDMGAVEFQTQLGAPRFCLGSDTSLGVPIALSAPCSPSVALNDLTVTAGPLPPGFAILAAGPGLERSAFGQGMLCIGGGLARSPVVAGSGVPHVFAVDLSQAPWTSIEVASTWYFQVLVRDAGSPAAPTANTSEAWRITFRP